MKAEGFCARAANYHTFIYALLQIAAVVCAENTKSFGSNDTAWHMRSQYNHAGAVANAKKWFGSII